MNQPNTARTSEVTIFTKDLSVQDPGRSIVKYTSVTEEVGPTEIAYSQTINLEDSDLQVRCVKLGDNLFIVPTSDKFPWWFDREVKPAQGTLATIRQIGDSFTKEVERDYRWMTGFESHSVKRTQVDCYLPRMGGVYYDWDPDNPDRVPFTYMNVEITAFGQTHRAEMRFRPKHQPRTPLA